MATLTIGWTEYPPLAFTGGAITVGNFDGVHLGHQELLAATVRHARQLGGPAIAITFDPPPIALLYPAARKPPLSTLEEKVARLHAAGADHVIVLRTEPALLALSPEAFFEDVILCLAKSRAVVEGYNFRFGRGRAGDTNTLRALCHQHGVLFEELPPLLEDGEPISSSRVRSAVASGDVTSATRWLGRPYAIEGFVETGAKRGRTIGFPTANLGDVQSVTPAVGVYAVRVIVDGRVWPAAANLGPNPTFGEDARKLEVHLIDFTGDLYGKKLRVEFITRLRDTRPFASIADLVEQLKLDVQAARTILSNANGLE